MKENILRELAIKVGEKFERVIERLTEMGEEIDEQTFKMLWNYSEKNQKECTFDELVVWVKENIPQNIKKACIYKEINRDKIQLQICFLDDKDNAILNGEYPHLIVNTFLIDEKLTNHFSDKNMIVLG